jgi:hypothetical protein
MDVNRWQRYLVSGYVRLDHLRRIGGAGEQLFRHEAEPFTLFQGAAERLVSDQRLIFGLIGLRLDERCDIFRHRHSSEAAREDHFRHALGGV